MPAYDCTCRYSIMKRLFGFYMAIFIIPYFLPMFLSVKIMGSIHDSLICIVFFPDAMEFTMTVLRFRDKIPIFRPVPVHTIQLPI